MNSFTETQSSALLNIITKIINCNNITSNGLVEIIKSQKLSEKDFLMYNTFLHNPIESYGRNKIYEGNNFVIYLMSWNSGDFTAIHSHGIADWGAVYFFADTNHRLYKAEGNKIELIEKAIIPMGTIVPVNGKLVHAMGNLTSNPYLTLHIYGSNKNQSNANKDSQVFEIEKNHISTTSGAAYINIDRNLCKKIDDEIITTIETKLDYYTIILEYYRRNNISDMVEFLEKEIKNLNK